MNNTAIAQVSLTVAQAAAVTGVSARTIDRATKAKDADALGVPVLPSKLLGNRRLILAKDLQSWVESLPNG